MKQYKRIGCALLAGILLCGVLSVAAPRRANGPIQQADVPTIALTVDKPTEYNMKIADRIQLQAPERTEPSEDEPVSPQPSGSGEDTPGLDTEPESDTPGSDTEADSGENTPVSDAEADSGEDTPGSDAEADNGEDTPGSDAEPDGEEDTPGSDTEPDTPDTIRWSSSSSAIASVTEDGLVTALAEGTAEIKGTYGNGDVVVCRVTVSGYAVTGITLTAPSATMRVGDTQTITASIEPQQAQGAALTWTSSHTDVLTVSDGGVATAVGEGQADILVKAENGYTVSYTIVVSGYALEGISIEPTSAQMKIGESKQLQLTVKPQQAETGTVTWKSDHPDIVTVDQKGLIKAVAAGSALITAKTEDGHTATCTVTVINDAVTGIQLDRRVMTLTVGGSGTLKATITPANLANTSISWTSSNSAVARVAGNGKVTGVRTGTAIITASAGTVKATCTVTVRANTNVIPTKPTITIPTTSGGGILYLPGSLVPIEAVRQYTMPKYVPSAAFVTIDSDLDTNTESILTVLAASDIRATFFVPIDDLYASDDMLRHIAGEGHSIGLLLTKVQAADGANVVQLLNDANEKLSVITGTPTRLVRVAGGSAGAVSSNTLYAMQAAGYRLWDWNDAARETSLTVQQSYQSVVAALNKTGTVSVRFGGGANTASVLQQLLPYMKYCGIPAKAISAGDTPICQIS